MDMLLEIAQTFVATCRDVFPVLALIVGFQYIILRQPIPRLRQVVVGFGCVLIGLTLFLVGLEKALFPLGKIMAKQLSAPEFVFGSEMAPENPEWRAYGWVYVFAALIGFATTIAEPALIAVAYKANQVSGRHHQPMGIAACRGLWGSHRDCIRDIPDHYRDSPFLVYRSRIPDSGGADYLCAKNHHPSCLRFRRGNHVYSNSSIGCGLRTGSLGNHTGTQPGPGRLWPDRLRKPVSHNNGDGLCPGCPVVGKYTFQVYQGGIT